MLDVAILGAVLASIVAAATTLLTPRSANWWRNAPARSISASRA